METLRQYLNSITPDEQSDFAARAGTTVGFLRKAISINQTLGEGLCIRLELASQGQVMADSLRPDVPWAEFRASRYP